MPVIDIAAIGAARKTLGFGRRTVVFEGGTIGDLLRALDTVTGANLYSRLVENGRVTGDYIILLDGAPLRPDQLQERFEGAGQVITMAILHPMLKVREKRP